MTLERWNPDHHDTSGEAQTQHTCQNCGAHVTPAYRRVFETGTGGIQCCPECEDVVRDNGKVREAKSRRGAARGARTASEGSA